MNPTQTPRRLLRSRDDRWIAGVCGGLGRYFNLDPVIVRLAAVALTFAGGAGIIAYAGAWLLVPEDGTESPLLKGSRNNRKLATIAGIALVACGGIAFLDSIDFWFDGGLFWAFVAIAAGGFLLIRYTDLGKRFGVTPHAATAAGPAAAGPYGGPPPTGAGPAPAGPAAGPYGGSSPAGPAPAGPSAGDPLAGPPAELAGPTSSALVRSGPAASPALSGDAAPTEPLGTDPTEPLDPATEPMDAMRSPIDDLPPNDPALVEERRQRRRRRRRTTAIALGVLLLLLGVAGSLVAADVVDVGTQTFLAGAVVLTGLTVVVASFFDGAPLLLWLGLVFAAGIGVVAAADLPIDKGVGDRVYRPATAAAVKPKYELGIGRLWIDMRNTRLPQGTTVVDAEVGIGELDVVVPDGVRVVAHGEADIGDVKLLDRNGSGTDIDKRLSEPLLQNGERVPRTVVINGNVGIGAMYVYRGADAPLPDDDAEEFGGTFGGGFASVFAGGIR